MKRRRLFQRNDKRCCATRRQTFANRSPIEGPSISFFVLHSQFTSESVSRKFGLPLRRSSLSWRRFEVSHVVLWRRHVIREPSRALDRAGLRFTKTSDEANPVYALTLRNSQSKIELFSKAFDHPSLPKDKFFAMMCCDDADNNCPSIQGAIQRFRLSFVDSQGQR